jgi:hypothetical protein
MIGLTCMARNVRTVATFVVILRLCSTCRYVAGRQSVTRLFCRRFYLSFLEKEAQLANASHVAVTGAVSLIGSGTDPETQ